MPAFSVPTAIVVGASATVMSLGAFVSYFSKESKLPCEDTPPLHEEAAAVQTEDAQPACEGGGAIPTECLQQPSRDNAGVWAPVDGLREAVQGQYSCICPCFGGACCFGPASELGTPPPCARPQRRCPSLELVDQLVCDEQLLQPAAGCVEPFVRALQLSLPAVALALLEGDGGAATLACLEGDPDALQAVLDAAAPGDMAAIIQDVRSRQPHTGGAVPSPPGDDSEKAWYEPVRAKLRALIAAAPAARSQPRALQQWLLACVARAGQQDVVFSAQADALPVIAAAAQRCIDPSPCAVQQTDGAGVSADVEVEPCADEPTAGCGQAEEPAAVADCDAGGAQNEAPPAGEGEGSGAGVLGILLSTYRAVMACVLKCAEDVTGVVHVAMGRLAVQIHA